MSEEVRAQLTGPIPSIRTPFTPDGDVDFAALDDLVDRCIDGGAAVLMLTAGDSHFLCLSDEEILEVTRATCRRARGRAQVIAADRSHSTARAVEFAGLARDAGAFCLMAMPPDWGGSTTPASLATHYAELARVLPVMIVTNIFIPRGEAFGLEAVGRALDASADVVSVKNDVGGGFARRLSLDYGDRAAILAGGQKVNHLEMLPFGGGQGYLSTFASLVPEVAARYWAAVSDGDLPLARRICATIDVPFFETVLGLPGGFDAGMHAALEAAGVGTRHRRPPYHTLDAAQAEPVRAFLESVPARLAALESGPSPSG